MGRNRSNNPHLPQNMRARKRGDKVWYYYDTGGKPRREIPLGSDYGEAVRQWAKLHTGGERPVGDRVTLLQVIERYQREIIPNKAPRTQLDNAVELKKIIEFFGNPPVRLDE